MAFCPQGEGLQGSISGVGAGAGINKQNINIILLTLPKTLTSCNSRARREGVSCVSRVTGTLSNVVGNVTRGVEATDPGTGVYTVLGDTGQVTWTLSVQDTLRLALNVGVALVVPDAGAAGGQPLLRADGVDTARRWVTGFRYDR